MRSAAACRKLRPASAWRLLRATAVDGPSVTRYEFMLEYRFKLSKLTNLADAYSPWPWAPPASAVPYPHKISVVGIEVPNKSADSPQRFGM